MADTFAVLQTAQFSQWLGKLRDPVGRSAIAARLTRLEGGHWGDCKNVGGEVIELRIQYGPGYRVYCWKDGVTIVVALGGGTKNGQQADIHAAKAMVLQLKEDEP